MPPHGRDKGLLDHGHLYQRSLFRIILLFMALTGADLEATMSTQEPKKSSSRQGTTSATSGMTEEDLEVYVLNTKFELSSMLNTMANSNYTGIVIFS